MAKTQIRLKKETVTQIKRLRQLDPILNAISLPELVNLLVVDGVMVRRRGMPKPETEAA